MKKIYSSALILLIITAATFIGCTKKDFSINPIDTSKYNDANKFPGLVGGGVPFLINERVEIDANYKIIETNTSEITKMPQAWISTGLYATPGKDIKINVPSGAVGLTAQIGVWTDNLSGENTQRDAVIFTQKKLVQGDNTIKSLYGGPIIIIPDQAVTNKIVLTISGGIKSPDFILDKITDAVWLDMINTSKVPWCELRGKNIILNLPVDKIKKYHITNPTELMRTWDDILEKDYYGWLSLNNAQKPSLPWRLVADIQPLGGEGHGGYPIVSKLDDIWFQNVTSVENISNSGNWNLMALFGANFDTSKYWTFDGLEKVSPYFHAFKTVNRLGNKHLMMSKSDFETALEFADIDNPNKKFSDLTNYQKLVPFIQIFELYGYEFYPAFLEKARAAKSTLIDNQAKVDFFYKKLSEFTQKDMITFLTRWGFLVSQSAQNEIKALFPATDTTIWNYNPWTEKGNDKIIIPWKILGVDSKDSGYGPNNLFDSDPGSFWNTQWYPSFTPFPHWVTVDMNATLKVNGFFFIYRGAGNNNQNPTKVSILAGNDPSNLTELVTKQIIPTAPNPAENKVAIPANTPSFRYFKIRFDEGQHALVMNLAEIGIY